MHKRIRWKETYDTLVAADSKQPLKPGKLETLALAAYLIGRDTQGYHFLQRAHQDYLGRQDIIKAVRCAIWLGLMLINIGEPARGAGWMARGERLLKEKEADDCAERGLLLIPQALKALNGGLLERARELFGQVAKIGEQFGDANPTALGRLGSGQALIEAGQLRQGLKLLDETMVTVETEELYPVVGGIVYCASIETCRKIWDLQRAHEWTAALTRWCEAQPDMIPFRGQCLVRRAEITQLYGDWPQALSYVEDACKLLTRPPAEPAAGEAYYRKAELQRLLGHYQAAEDAYREASKRGRKPQPGLALLRLAQGEGALAETALKNLLHDSSDISKQAEILPALVEILSARKRHAAASQLSEQFTELAQIIDTPYLQALSRHYRALVLYNNDEFKAAGEALREALKTWKMLPLPYELARSRELLGLVFLGLDDRDNANSELEAAQWLYQQLKAHPDLQRISQKTSASRSPDPHGLSLRELQVLRQVASGKTNKLVAAELFISERTVDRHVSNVFNKLGVSSRVEATTFALRHKILET